MSFQNLVKSLGFFMILMLPIWVNAAVYIDTINGPLWAFVIKRNGQELTEIAPSKPLQAGDEIQVFALDEVDDPLFEDPENAITLALGNGKSVTLKYEDTKDKPYRVEKSTPPSVFTNILEDLSKWFHELWDKDVQNRRLALGLEGKPKHSIPLTMFLLQEGNLRLVAGKRELHLTWHGGEPPYRVRVALIGSDKALWNEHNITKATVVLNKQPIAVGRYQVIVSDAKANLVSGQFTVVADLPLLSHPEVKTIIQSDLPEPSKQTLLAAWLWTQEKGIWGFEVYQRVAKIKGYYPALLIKGGLERGERPE